MLFGAAQALSERRQRFCPPHRSHRWARADRYTRSSPFPRFKLHELAQPTKAINLWASCFLCDRTSATEWSVSICPRTIDPLISAPVRAADSMREDPFPAAAKTRGRLMNAAKYSHLAAMFLAAVAVALLFLAGCDEKKGAPVAQTGPAPSASAEYVTDIQPIFNRRCIACHGCLGSPCNVKLDSFRGADRGGFASTLTAITSAPALVSAWIWSRLPGVAAAGFLSHPQPRGDCEGPAGPVTAL